MKKIITLSIAGAACIFGFQSCKKKPKEPVCKIQQIMDNSSVITFQYDDAFRISNMSSGTSTSTFSYSGNTTTILTTSGGSFSSKTILTRNDADLVINARTENNTSGTDWENNAYTYSGKELTSQLSTSSSGGPSTTTFGWQNGNLFSQDGTPLQATYSDKPYQEGDYLHLFETIIRGYTVLKNKNTITSLAGTTFVYTYDDKGKITSLSINGGSPINYSYTCR